MPDFRRGASAIAEAQKKAKSGSFSPFTPEIFWQDGDERYLLFLNPIEDVVTVDAIGFIPVKGKKADGETYTRYERVIARTDSSIGEDFDPMEKEWDGQIRETCVAVAVELEPTFTEVNGRKRPTGFAVKTREFERRIRDEDGDLTDEYEDVVAPGVGLIHASPHNFFNVVTSYDANDAPIAETPVKVTRVGEGNSTTYSVQGYPELEIDLSDLIYNADGITYLGDDLEAVIEEFAEIDNDLEAAHLIGAAILDKRLDELCDRDRYDKLFNGITETLNKWGGKKDKKGKAKTERPKRRSQRAAKEEPEAEVETDAEPEAEEKPKRTRRTAAKSTTKVDDDAPAPDRTAGRKKINELRARAEKRKAAET